MRRRRASKSSKQQDGSFIRYALVVALLAWAFRSFLFTPFSIPSGSMLPTLYIGDYLAVAKWPYGYNRYSFPFRFPPIQGRIFGSLPDRGDVVVFAPPGNERADFIKRVIGLPGDRIEVQDGRVILNGKPLPRTRTAPAAVTVSENSPCRRITSLGVALSAGENGRCLYPTYRETLPNGVSYSIFDQVNDGSADNFPAVTVPEGHVFLMGDNRDDSQDSRFAVERGGIGFVPLRNLVGRATTIFWSTDGSASYWKPWTWFGALRANRIGDGFGERR